MAELFKDKTVLITGAAGHLGQAVTAKFAAEGAQLVLTGRSQTDLDSMVKSLKLKNPVLTVSGDMGKPDDVAAVLKAAESRFDKVHVLAHIAGGFAAGKAVHEDSLAVFEKMMMLNAQLPFVTGGGVARHMLEKNVSGSMVFVLARAALKGAKNTAAYTASKAAAQRIMESMAVELRENNIRVNGVMPSIIDTPTNRKDMPKADFSKWVTPEQVADVILFLASEASGAISGDSVEVYGKA